VESTRLKSDTREKIMKEKDEKKEVLSTPPMKIQKTPKRDDSELEFKISGFSATPFFKEVLEESWGAKSNQTR